MNTVLVSFVKRLFVPTLGREKPKQVKFEEATAANIRCLCLKQTKSTLSPLNSNTYHVSSSTLLDYN